MQHFTGPKGLAGESKPLPPRAALLLAVGTLLRGLCYPSGRSADPLFSLLCSLSPPIPWGTCLGNHLVCLFVYLFIFNCSILDLQCCVSFRCTTE